MTKEELRALSKEELLMKALSTPKGLAKLAAAMAAPIMRSRSALRDVLQVTPMLTDEEMEEERIVNKGW